MGTIIIFGFFLWCLLALLFLLLAPPLLILFFPLEQLIQSSSSFFRDTAFGLQTTNYIVAFTVALTTGYAVFKSPQRFQGILNSTTIIIGIMFIWTLLSCLWSPGRAKGFEVFVSTVPYLAMFFIFMPLLITSLTDWSRVARLCLVLGTIISGLILISPEFTVKFGRLGLDMASEAKGGRSSPLALGELGGTCIVLAVFVGTKFDRLYFKAFRGFAVLLGTILVVQSGSRGQLMFAVITVALSYPIGRQFSNAKNYIFAMMGLAFILILIYYIAGQVANTGSLDTEKRWAEGATSQGVDVRLGNIIFLLETWLKSPAFWIQGLGFYSFGELNPFGEPYTHAIVVDMLGELGLIGFTLFSTMCLLSWISCRKIFIAVRNDPTQRANFSSLAAMLIYQFLLSNKQGNIAGSFLMFSLILLAARIEKSPDFYSDIITVESNDSLEQISDIRTATAS
jgi:hypothetical protein